MAEFTPFPDIEAVCSTALRDADVCDGRVYSSVPSRPTYPLAVVERLGGTAPIRQRLDAARIQVSVWADSKSDARDAAELARQTLHATMEGSAYLTLNAFVTGVEDETGLTWLPDPATSRDRYLFSVLVYAHHHE